MQDAVAHRQVAVVTGGSRGIGRSVAISLAKNGVDVVVNYNKSVDDANDVVETCKRFGTRALAVQADVQFEQDVDYLFTMATQLGLPSILVNNAGVEGYGQFSDMSLTEWNRIIGVNLTGAFLCCKRALPYLRLAKHPRIVNISSIHGLSGASCEAAYAASKGGLIAFTKSLAKELAPSQITVNAVAPGIIETDMIRRFQDSEISEMRKRVPMERLGRPDDVAGIVQFLVSLDSDYVTGQVISPNGGLLT